MAKVRQTLERSRGQPERSRGASATDSMDDPPSRRPRVSEEMEARVLEISFQHPSRGQDRIARDLWDEKMHVSASGVRYVWQRQNLETLSKRIDWVARRLGSDDRSWSAEQLAARDRVQASRISQTLGASIAGGGGDAVPRSMYILAIAARLFRENSVDSVSLRDVAERSKVPLGSIYYHYPVKEELFAAVYEEGIRRLNRAIGEVILQVSDPWEKLESASAAHLANLCGGDDFTAVSIPTKTPRLSVEMRSHISRLDESYERNFRTLIDALPMADDVSPSLFRLQLLGALNWTSTWFRAGKMTPDQIARQLIGSLRYGVQAGSKTWQSKRTRSAVPKK